jgi:hypothetical protein
VPVRPVRRLHGQAPVPHLRPLPVLVSRAGRRAGRAHPRPAHDDRTAVLGGTMPNGNPVFVALTWLAALVALVVAVVAR